MLQLLSWLPPRDDSYPKITILLDLPFIWTDIAAAWELQFSRGHEEIGHLLVT